MAVSFLFLYNTSLFTVFIFFNIIKGKEKKKIEDRREKYNIRPLHRLLY